MKHFLTRLPKKSLIAITGFVAAIVATAGVVAWGPSRPTFTIANPANYVTFNSITDNPNQGDERAFFGADDATGATPLNASDFLHSQKVNDGQTVMLRVYVHNNGSDNLNDAAHNYKGIARNTKVRIFVPTATASALRANAYISADNAAPKVVFDDLDLLGSQPFSLQYVQGSAVAYNNLHKNGMPLSDSIVGSGALIGYQKADGKLPGCFQYVNVVTIKVKVKMNKPAYTIAKQVALPGGQWAKNVTAQPGQTLSYSLSFKNTGNTTLNNVVIRDQLPARMKIVPGSTKIYNSNHPNGVAAGNDAIVGNGGINIGSYNAGSNAYVIFKASVDQVDKLNCGSNNLKNIGEASLSHQGPVTDNAVATVTRTCDTPSKPVYSCDALTVTSGQNRMITAKISYTAQGGASLKTINYDFGDGSAPLMTDKTQVDYTYTSDGTYTVKATLTFNVNGTDKTAICSQNVTVTTPAPPVVLGKELPDTGPGSAVGIFAAVSTLAAGAHYVVSTRRADR